MSQTNEKIMTSIKKTIQMKQNQESTLSLINSIKDNRQIIKFLQFLDNFTSMDKTLKQCGSNQLNQLVKMKLNQRNKNFENIKIQNTSLVGIYFFYSILRVLEFKKINISGMNLKGAQLFNCKWNNLRIHQLNKFEVYSDILLFSCDANKSTLIIKIQIKQSQQLNLFSMLLFDRNIFIIFLIWRQQGDAKNRVVY
ncbi:unnamed protein product [Paramecium pentaurelia]|uniref:Uncharacterized protein n=1 Tax=Paramecium pentaurelia TaxID=43138 RepID=A0A8S1VBL0_9CILI|nr:unnamed protein product [Paramecium pentaurelia]